MTHEQIYRAASTSALEAIAAMNAAVSRTGALPSEAWLETLTRRIACELVVALEAHAPLDQIQIASMVHGMLATCLGAVKGGMQSTVEHLSAANTAVAALQAELAELRGGDGQAEERGC